MCAKGISRKKKGKRRVDDGNRSWEYYWKDEEKMEEKVCRIYEDVK